MDDLFIHSQQFRHSDATPARSCKTMLLLQGINMNAPLPQVALVFSSVHLLHAEKFFQQKKTEFTQQYTLKCTT